MFTDTDNLSADLDRFFNTPFAYRNYAGWTNAMFPDIAIPMKAAYVYYKKKDFILTQTGLQLPTKKF